MSYKDTHLCNKRLEREIPEMRELALKASKGLKPGATVLGIVGSERMRIIRCLRSRGQTRSIESHVGVHFEILRRLLL